MGRRKCKFCGVSKIRETMFIPNLSAFCNREHAIQYAIQNQSKGRKKIEQVERKAINKAKKNNLKTRKDAAKKACHDFIRARDSGKGCSCCGEPLGKDFQAGHFLESGNNPKIRYDEDNIHGQRLHCNYFKGGDSGEYKERLIKKIGSVRVNRLLNLKGGTVKRTPDDYRAIEKYYKGKLKELKSHAL